MFDKRRSSYGAFLNVWPRWRSVDLFAFWRICSLAHWMRPSEETKNKKHILNKHIEWRLEGIMGIYLSLYWDDIDIHTGFYTYRQRYRCNTICYLSVDQKPVRSMGWLNTSNEFDWFAIIFAWDYLDFLFDWRMISFGALEGDFGLYAKR